MIKPAIIAIAFIATSSAQAQTSAIHDAPTGYSYLTANLDEAHFYFDASTIKPQRFINGHNPAKLAMGTVWKWPEQKFNRVVANCTSKSIALVHLNAQGGEMAGTWTIASPGTVAWQIVDVFCTTAYGKVKSL